MNDILISGVMMNDPTFNKKEDGVSWSSFLLKNTSLAKNGKTKFLDIRCVAFDKCAAAICHSFKKDDEILIRGRLNPKKYTAKDGTTKEGMEILVRYFEKFGHTASVSQNVVF